ncbi:MAG: hypothetical protein A3F22_04510 [Candidatus Magasanikbacteria bacterium RIFCSPHIGHO2_12_FULL_41_16]|uniref:Transcobalamin-like C-terminal domain-containing protein n=1 Tax=Candidatus Magasanikbacteria bacterium RIFCSPLOWO2_01_FULL_40_15 TaxID=1798686 RepID=A0A1F6N3V2_9BACT|nr:MAG: hypothetical protein A3F22_04510 [Candidatus Magasanikbacteria bacterium RIFCSPHIGHO2_12_FULL_41_16]OGH78552.1 MAG: hypothetical protein A2983_02710 [Candidatus Magasanikbacteria bacterium RIFCSPLOWO2_01_FULL_40_15]
MRCLKILRRHWLATIILFGSLILMIIYGNSQNIESNSNKLLNQESQSVEIKLKEKSISVPTNQNYDTENKNENNTSTQTNSPKTIEQKPNADALEKNLIAAKIIIGENEYLINVTPSSSVYDALIQMNKSGQASFNFKEFSGLGYFVEGINGKTSDKLRGRYWIYYINGVKAQMGISQYILKSNDIITWKYENQE